MLSVAGADALNAAMRARGLTVHELDLSMFTLAAAAPIAWRRRFAASAWRAHERSCRRSTPRRVIADLRELDRRTGGPDGAQRLCWGDGWREARSLLAELLGEIGLTAKADAAGNLWASLEGEQEPALALGSHLDSVPDGGWLDGALGVMAALERAQGVVRRRASARRGP